MHQTADKTAGTLYVVATPIGNLDDMTFRAVRILKSVDFAAAEDTRHTMKLFSRFDIQTELVSLNEHNEEKKAATIAEKLTKGKSAALVSSAGTPSVSDPGLRLVRVLTEKGIAIVPVPGCSAAVAGLSVAGLPTDAFRFCGFLSKKTGKKAGTLSALKDERATLIFYESPRRVVDLMEACIDVLGNRPAMLAREMTKLHEEYIRGPLSHIIEKLKQRDSVKGECTLYIKGADKNRVDPDVRAHLEDRIAEYLRQSDRGTSQTARDIAREFSLSRKEAYTLVLKFKEQLGGH